MKLAKAIEILSQSDKTNLGITLKEIMDAEELGIEALKRHQVSFRLTRKALNMPLPGETKDFERR